MWFLSFYPHFYADFSQRTAANIMIILEITKVIHKKNEGDHIQNNLYHKYSST